MLYYPTIISLCVCSCRGRSKVVTSLPLPLDSDDDVRAERSKVTAEEGDSEILRMNALSRVYRTNLGRSRRVAVNQLCLSVNKGEVCGRVCMCVCVCVCVRFNLLYKPFCGFIT